MRSGISVLNFKVVENKQNIERKEFLVIMIPEIIHYHSMKMCAFFSRVFVLAMLDARHDNFKTLFFREKRIVQLQVSVEALLGFVSLLRVIGVDLNWSNSPAF